MWNNDSVTNYGKLGLSFGNISTARDFLLNTIIFQLMTSPGRHPLGQCTGAKGQYNNGLIVILPHIVRLKIANTGDKPPQPVISGYLAIFPAFYPI